MTLLVCDIFWIGKRILYAAQFNIDLIPLLLKAALSLQTASDSTQPFAGAASLVEAQDTDGQAFVH